MTMTSKTNVTPFAFDRACHNLTRFAFSEAARVTKTIGISYAAADNAPASGKAIAAAFEACRREVRAFPVYGGGCERTIYDVPAANLAFRFWHDFYHWIMAAGVGLADELRIAERHASRARDTFGADSLEALVQLLDVSEQARFYSVTGEFVEDQKAFVYACVTQDLGALAALSQDFADDFLLRQLGA
jgi:hypothetical protein